MVIATENPIEQQGTYPLPEAQLDRFLFKHTLAYPSEAEELALVQAQGATVRMPDPIALGFAPVVEREQLADCVSLVSTAKLSERGCRLYRQSDTRHSYVFRSLAWC